ncbi:glycoside hydrolase family 15 protein [Hallella bergensis]|uniref:glycoside hydrolase family 15 protein n=1 Tax=Hallella bergensis TaxID=242750 RepID=UPI0023F42F91|nr:glycoside hydrolase family 15 protein [Hallella bergensis]
MSKNLNYGIVGNGSTAALISEHGFVEWFCLPHFDSSSCFAALLDDERGGKFGIKLVGDYDVRQSYVPHTNILTTHYVSDEAEFKIFDFMPCYYHPGTTNLYNPSELYRYIRYIKGVPRFSVVYEPRPDYARGECVLAISFNHIESYSTSNERDRQYLYSSIPLESIVSQEVFTLEKDEFFLFSSNEKLTDVTLEREKADYCRTMVFWLNWSEQTKKYEVYNDVIERSLLTLKLLSFDNGAMMAALTTSLPETIGETRNWDYRFCWLRDASMSIETLVKLGHTRSAKRFMQFVRSTFVANHDSFQIMYGIRGEQKLHEEELTHLSGYENSKPVRVGNAAYHQKQNDSYGYLMNLIYQYFTLLPSRQEDLEDIWDMVKNIMATVQKEWKKADKGIWEIRGKAQHFVSSKVMCWVALDRGARIAALLHREQFAKDWRGEADRVKNDVMKKGWNEELKSFTQTYNNTAMDSSLLLMEEYGFIDGQDPKYKSTVRMVKKELFHHGLMYRYNAPDDFGTPKSAFTLCTFWLIRALFVTGKKEKAQELFNQLLGYSNHLGLFSEDIDFKTKRLLGNFPQAYSHLALVNSALLFTQEINKPF